MKKWDYKHGTRCPVCGKSIAFESDEVVCTSCGTRWRVRR